MAKAGHPIGPGLDGKQSPARRDETPELCRIDLLSVVRMLDDAQPSNPLAVEALSAVCRGIPVIHHDTDDRERSTLSLAQLRDHVGRDRSMVTTVSLSLPARYSFATRRSVSDATFKAHSGGLLRCRLV